VTRTVNQVFINFARPSDRSGGRAICFGFVALAATVLAGCSHLPRATCSDEAFAEYMQVQAEKLPIPGVYELRTTAAGGHVTLGGRVDSPETLKELVKVIAMTPGLTQLSFFGVEFEPADVPDTEIASNARQAVAAAVGEELTSQLGFYCEDHRLFVHGRVPSSVVRERIDETVRRVPGVGLYHVSCEVILENPPSDDQVVAAVRRKFRRVGELPNLTFRASQIEVRSVNNVVHLSGRAPSYLGKLSAGSQAAHVEGVRYVINRIVVPDIRPADMQPGQSPPPGDAAPNGGEIQSANWDEDSLFDDEEVDLSKQVIFIRPVAGDALPSKSDAVPPAKSHEVPPAEADCSECELE